jgi:hypothetical protein
MKETTRSSQDGAVLPLSLVVGVIGHRDRRHEDREPLTAQVRGVFAELQTRYPSTPLLLLSALAEGADQLVAQVALEKGGRLIVPLPLPKALYEGFQTQASRDAFNQLLQRADYWFELPLPQDVRAEEIRRPGLARDQHYAKGGADIILHSQLLLAMWDGTHTNQVGGTSQIVQFQLRGVPKSYASSQSPLHEPERGALSSGRIY